MTRWIAALLMVIAPTVAAAQTTASKPTSRLELEAYGSIGRMLDAGEATLSLPAAGAPITTSNPMFPSRRVPSWFFGDGATLLNAVNEQLGLTARITPLDAAIATINRDSSSHSDAIVTADEAAARRFLAGVDSATVYWNASTRFTDGFEFGYGAEIGISTDRLHARGPMGLRELCSYKFVIEGTGQVRA